MRFPHAKVHFEEYVMNIDLSKFNNVDLNEENYTTTYKMQKVNHLKKVSTPWNVILVPREKYLVKTLTKSTTAVR